MRCDEEKIEILQCKIARCKVNCSLKQRQYWVPPSVIAILLSRKQNTDSKQSINQKEGEKTPACSRAEIACLWVIPNGPN